MIFGIAWRPAPRSEVIWAGHCDEGALARYAEMARSGGRELFAMDPTTIALTDQGFLERR